MEVRVRLYGALGRYRPEGAPEAGPFPLELPEGATVAGVVERLGAPASWVRSAFVNEEPSGKDRVLRPGDQLALFPPAGGGM